MSPVSRWLPSSHGSATTRRLPASVIGRSSATRNWCRVAPRRHVQHQPAVDHVGALVRRAGEAREREPVGQAHGQRRGRALDHRDVEDRRHAQVVLADGDERLHVVEEPQRADRRGRAGVARRPADARPAARRHRRIDDQPALRPRPPRDQRAVDGEIGSLARRVDRRADRAGAELRQLRRGPPRLRRDGPGPLDLQRERAGRQHRVEHAVLLQDRHAGSSARAAPWAEPGAEPGPEPAAEPAAVRGSCSSRARISVPPESSGTAVGPSRRTSPCRVIVPRSSSPSTRSARSACETNAPVGGTGTGTAGLAARSTRRLYSARLIVTVFGAATDCASAAGAAHVRTTPATPKVTRWMRMITSPPA